MERRPEVRWLLIVRDTALMVGCSLFTVMPAAAQHRSDTAIDRPTVRATVQRVEQQQHREADRWAAQRHLPRRLPQADGSMLYLIGVENTRPIYLTPHNRTAATVTGTRGLHPGERLGLGLTGAGLQIGIWDQSGVLAEHQELEGRVVSGDGARPGRHATGVAGTLAAAGVHPGAQGMAYQAGLRSFDWGGDLTELLAEAEQGLLLSNHSYGTVAGWYYGNLEQTGAQWYWFGDPRVSREQDYAFGRYSSRAAQFDRITAANPYLLPVLAAGNDRGDQGPTAGAYRGLNGVGIWQTYDLAEHTPERDGGPDGYDSIAEMATAKNVLTVGSIELGADGRPVISPVSSAGPTDDGRIKPDLLGFGDRVVSTFALEPDAYGTANGTSVAAANVTGSLLLLQEHHRDVTGTFMRAASLKGLVVHTARDLGLPGPDYESGWGLLDAEAAADQITATRANPAALHEGALDDGFSYLQTVTVTQPGPLRVTLAWTDPPSSPLPLNGPAALNAATPHLRHDLDLRIIEGTTGVVYAPFALDPANPGAPAGRSDNGVDPVEQVVVPQAAPGPYVVAVSHKESLDAGAAQPFTLLVSGAVSAAPAVAAARLDAEVTANAVVLNWKAWVERDQGAFHVERAAAPADRHAEGYAAGFAHLATLSVRASSTAAQAYAFRDEDIPPGHYRYRIVYRDQELHYVIAEREVSVLPVWFDQLQAGLHDEAVVLRWETLAERRPAMFHVERAAAPCGPASDETPLFFALRATLPTHGPTSHAQTYTFRDATVRDGCYRYRLWADDQQARYFLTEVDVDVPAPGRFAVVSNYPNPFRGQTSLVVDLVYPYTVRRGRVRVDVYDVAGRRVARLHDGPLLPGRHAFPLDASRLAPGVYFAHVVLDHDRVPFEMVDRAERILTHPLTLIE